MTEEFFFIFEGSQIYLDVCQCWPLFGQPSSVDPVFPGHSVPFSEIHVFFYFPKHCTEYYLQAKS